MAYIDDTLPPQVAPGTYAVMLDHFYTALMYQARAHKLVCIFTIVEHGNFHGVKLPRYYNVKRLIGKPQVGGRFVATPTGDFAREFYTLFQYGGNRLDRLPMSLFEGKTIKAKVSLVTKARGRSIPEPLQYSKVAELLKVIEE